MSLIIVSISGVCSAKLHRGGDLRPMEKHRRDCHRSQLSRRKPSRKLKVCQRQQALFCRKYNIWCNFCTLQVESWLMEVCAFEFKCIWHLKFPRCAKCRKVCWSPDCLTGMRCCWCGLTVSRRWWSDHDFWCLQWYLGAFFLYRTTTIRDHNMQVTLTSWLP